MGYTTGTQWTTELVRKALLAKGYTLLNEYEGALFKFTYCDSYGYKYYQNISMFLKGEGRVFHSANPYTIYNIKLWCKLNNKSFVLISNEYKDSKTKLEWQCLKNDCQEIFFASWNSISVHKGCPYCTGVKIGNNNCLAIKNVKLASEWHPTKNGNLTSYDVTINSGKRVWWQCKRGHEWKAVIASRNNNKNCPYCSKKKSTFDYNLLINNPELCNEWNYKENNKKPEDYCPNSGEYVWWICSNGHEWKDSIAHRNSEIGNRNCPYCSGHRPSKNYNLLLNNPLLCEEWDYIKNNKKPEEHTPSSAKKVWWKCKECNNSWLAAIYSRNKENGVGCPSCNNSKGESKIKSCLNDFGFNQIEEFNVDIYNSNYYIPQKTFNNLFGIGGGLLSYDLYLPRYNLLIEYQGQYHDGTVSNQTKLQFERQQEHDRRKREFAKTNNINLLEIWYYDFDKIEEILSKELKIQNNN